MIKVREYHRPKLGNSEGEYEDAFAFNLRTRRFAIADGASDSIFSNIWAQNLVDSFTKSTVPLRYRKKLVRSLLSQSREKWFNSIEWNDLKWFVKNKAVKGSFSTFLGIEIRKRGNNYHYNGVTVGDSCLFTLNEELFSFPMKQASEFNITPNLMWSGYGSPFNEEYKWDFPKLTSFDGNLLPGDSIILATDSISKWILEDGANRYRFLLESPDPMEKIEELLQAREMRNDDITLAIITLEP